MVKPGSYAEKLQQVKLGIKTPIPPRPVAEKSKENLNLKESSNTNDNGLPFTDEMYDHLKYVISTLTGRMKSNQSLSHQELQRFLQSVDAIIKDAIPSMESEYEDEEGVDQLTNNNQLTTENNNQFSNFGGTSSWVIPGMENMSTEEYYAAVNQRLHSIRNQRKQDPSYSRMVSQDYFNSLNSRKQ